MSMRHPDPPPGASAAATAARELGDDLPVVDVATLLGGGREALLLHDGQAYRLRITANRKLILTK